MKTAKLNLLLVAGLALLGLTVPAAIAAPPVRVAVVPGNGSGMEQEVVDRITSDLQGNPNVSLSTVNPDWFVQCNIVDRTDTAGGSVRVNGTVVIKTLNGHVLNTVSMQTNKQDFSLQPGTPVNKRLFDNAAREVVQGIVDRARQPLATAVDLEMTTRDQLIKAQSLADQDKYDEAIQTLTTVSQDSPHFQDARKLIAIYLLEKEACEAMTEAKALAQKGKYSQAIEAINHYNKTIADLKKAGRNKRYPSLAALLANCRAKLSARRHSPGKTTAKSSASTDAQLQALDAQKKALDAQRKAIDAQESALKNKTR
ncbi:MAG: hypothetical protein K2W82_01380 [Candidatus Obscuribacterales bacterium]|nr:hypothetical protein [Candidatus Obscuribacterales bacterium]